MEFLGNHFIYNGVDSIKYGLIFANVDSDEYLNIGNSPTAKTIFNHQTNKTYITGNDYADANISFDIAVVNENSVAYTSLEQKRIKRWLFAQNDYCKLYIDRYDDPDSYELSSSGRLGLYLNCRFTNPSAVISGEGVVGYKFTVECDSAMAWQDPTVKIITASDISLVGENGIVIDVDSDHIGYTYPKVEITVSGDGDIEICNITDDSERATKFRPKSEVDNDLKGVLVINSNTNFVSDNKYDRFVGQNFPRLLSGQNRIKIGGNITEVKFTWVNRRLL